MKKVAFAAIAAVGILIAGCNRETTGYEDESAPGSLKITVQNENASDSATRAQGLPSSADESRVHSFTVYVFNYSTGVLERAAVFNDELEGEILDLSTAYSKRVVVLVNDNFTNTADIGNYSDLTGRVFDISTQDPVNLTTNGLFMSGEYSSEVTLNSTTATTITVDVRRVVAKVILENLTISVDPATELDRFVLEGVSVQRVPVSAYMLGELVPVLGDGDYRGGLTGSISTSLGSLNQTYTLPADYVNGDTETPEIYFYTFPNDNSRDRATLLSLHGTYDGVDAYYTFLINNVAGSQTTDGTWIQRNKIYILNVTLRNPGLGADDPDTVNELGDLIVELNVIDWEDELIQDVEW